MNAREIRAHRKQLLANANVMELFRIQDSCLQKTLFINVTTTLYSIILCIILLTFHVASHYFYMHFWEFYSQITRTAPFGSTSLVVNMTGLKAKFKKKAAAESRAAGAPPPRPTGLISRHWSNL